MFRDLIEETRQVLEGGGSRRSKAARQAKGYSKLVYAAGSVGKKATRSAVRGSNIDRLAGKAGSYAMDKDDAKGMGRRVPKYSLAKGTQNRADLKRLGRERRMARGR